MQKRYPFLVSLVASACITSAFAAQEIDLSHQSAITLKSLTMQSNLKLLSQKSDINQTLHSRYQQTYQGYPVWGGDVIVHAPKGAGLDKATMDGAIYQDLQKDLSVSPVVDLENAVSHAKTSYRGNVSTVSQEKAEFMVYIDSASKAHWAYLVSFVVKPENAMIQKPTFVMDATSFEVYLQWDNIQTLDNVNGGGFGGNPKMGKLIYDGLSNNLPILSMQRDAATRQCFLKNADVTVKNVSKKDAVSQFTCNDLNSQHGNIFWSEELGATNGAYSPDNDALYVGQVIKQMYQNWYGIPVLSENGKPMMLNMRVHENMENAYWDGSQMTFGDGGSMFYPLVSLGVGAHEVSHGFTQQHSNLFYLLQSGGLNESFSDMAAQAAEYYSSGQNTWQIGPEIVKGGGALRYMDEPTKDCNGKAPGSSCSISHVKDYNMGLNVHYSSGVFNKVFYLIATSTSWDTRKAFDIMVQANQYYWTKNTNFNKAACGVVKATKDLHYPVESVNSAFKAVGINTSTC